MRVVIDPGHGAPDPGARGRMSNEADVNLDVSFFIARFLSEKFKITAPLTRTGQKRLYKDNRHSTSARPLQGNRLRLMRFVSSTEELSHLKRMALRYTRLQDKITRIN